MVQIRVNNDFFLCHAQCPINDLSLFMYMLKAQHILFLRLRVAVAFSYYSNPQFLGKTRADKEARENHSIIAHRLCEILKSVCFVFCGCLSGWPNLSQIIQVYM